nr:transposase [Vibrio metschnikovii]
MRKSIDGLSLIVADVLVKPGLFSATAAEAKSRSCSGILMAFGFITADW